MPLAQVLISTELALTNVPLDATLSTQFYLQLEVLNPLVAIHFI
jgi:hypothetical protein